MPAERGPAAIRHAYSTTYRQRHCYSRKLHFVLQASGYVEFDTAGQPNMYPVITKAYEAGSDLDTANTGSANLVVGIGAAVIAVGVLAVGLGALTQQSAARKLQLPHINRRVQHCGSSLQLEWLELRS